jgi:hypothetical protein
VRRDRYEQYAFGTDELRPHSRTGHNWLGQGGTIVDSLDTLWIMGLKDEFEKGRAWVRVGASKGGTNARSGVRGANARYKGCG